jgi:hypothetical protein
VDSAEGHERQNRQDEQLAVVVGHEREGGEHGRFSGCLPEIHFNGCANAASMLAASMLTPARASQTPVGVP